MTRNVKLNILRAKELIADESLWLKGRWYSHEAGRPTKRCAYAALCAITKDMPLSECEVLAAAMGSVARGRAATTRVLNFNDNNSHQKVMELFDAAAELASLSVD
jgi:hypothetical protein